jgi:hypothetical protein
VEPSRHAQRAHSRGHARLSRGSSQKLDHAEARNLVWMLAQMRAMVETQALSNPEEVITVAEMEVRPTKRTSFPTRIVRVLVDPAPMPEVQGHSHGIATANSAC